MGEKHYKIENIKMYVQIYAFVFVSINTWVLVSIKPASENSPN